MRNPLPASVTVPILETERLTLRGHRLDDFVPCSVMWADASVTRYIRDQPFTEEESWSRLLRYAGHWVMLGFGYWAVVEKESGKFVGEVGFADYKRDLQPSLNGTPEIGWVLASQAQGRGYATEAVRAAIAWGDAHFGATRTACLIDPENLPSIRVAVKCGYRESQPATYKGHSTMVFVREPGASR